MAHYDPWRDYLMTRSDDAVALSFDLLGKMAALPASAWKHDRWRVNEDPASTTHVQCKLWQAAGFDAEVDRAHAMVTFRRRASARHRHR